MIFNFDNFLESLVASVKTIPVTLLLAFVAFGISLILGVFIAAVRIYRIPIISQISTFFVAVYSGIPIVVALLIYQLIYQANYQKITIMFHLTPDDNVKCLFLIAGGALVLSIVCVATEAIRGALNSVATNQFEAGYSIGMTKVQTFCKIILPQALPAALPALLNILVGSIKATNLVSVIGIVEIMNGALKPARRTYSYLEAYIAAAIVYWMLTIVIEQIAKQIEKTSTKHRRQLQ